MAGNVLGNLKSVVGEFDVEQTENRINLDKKWNQWLENFEVCIEFEGVADEKKKAALLALGGQKLRTLAATLDVKPTTDFENAKKALNDYFRAKKNTSAERYKFFCMKQSSTEETTDRWVTRLREKVTDCEFEKFDNNEAIKMVLMLHTTLPQLQRSILGKDLTLEQTLESARSIELTNRELGALNIGNISPAARGRSAETGNELFEANQSQMRREGYQQGQQQQGGKPTGRQYVQVCRYCGERADNHKVCRAKLASCRICKRKGHYARMCEKKDSSRTGGGRNAYHTEILEEVEDESKLITAGEHRDTQ